MIKLPPIFTRYAKQTAKQIVVDLGETRADRVAQLTEHAESTNGHLLTKTALDSLVPEEWDANPPAGAVDAVNHFWALFRPLVIAKLKVELGPYRKAVKAEWNRRNKAVREGREW
jgi:hypothetical protein